MKRYIVRYGTMRQVGVFTDLVGARLERRDPVVLRTDRGIEWGEVLVEVSDCPTALANASDGRQVLRRPTPLDRRRYAEFSGRRREFFDICCRVLDRHRVPVQLVDVEQLLSGEKLVLHILARQAPDDPILAQELARRCDVEVEWNRVTLDHDLELDGPSESGGCTSCGTCDACQTMRMSGGHDREVLIAPSGRS